MRLFRRSKPSVPVLTYHGNNVHDNSYAGNDHIAFESDLRTIDRMGLRILPLATVVDWHQGLLPDSEVEDGVALTMDDGSWLDYHDIEHPTCGVQKGMFKLLAAFRDETPGQATVHASSFVIASPDDRIVLDQRNLAGLGWWGDDWWADAHSSGLMSIECHSWDHVHPTLDTVAQQDNVRGDFGRVDTFEDCSVQVEQAAEYIDRATGSRPRYFAYPWGQASDYLRKDYMPRQQERHGFRAAFSIEPRRLSRKDDTWFLPRFVCGEDWKSPEELEGILGA